MKETIPGKGKEFDKVFLECASSTLEDILGRSCAKAILYHVRASTIGVEAFAEALEGIFGSGAYALEKSILTNLYSRAGKTFQEKEGYKFIDYIGEIKSLIKGTRGSDMSL